MRSAKLSLVIFVGIVHFCSCSASLSPFYIKGMSEVEKGNYLLAIQEFDNGIREEPENPDLYFGRAKANQMLKRYERAVSDYSKVIQLRGPDDEVLLSRAFCYFYMDEIISAFNDVSRSILMNPRNHISFFLRGYINSIKKAYGAALMDYDRSLDLNPRYAEAFVNRGNIKAELGDHLGAINDFTDAIELNPNDENAFINRGTDKAIIGDYEGAIEDFSFAIIINPARIENYFLRGEAKAMIEDFQGAINDYSAMLNLNDKDARALYFRGIARLNINDRVNACNDFTRAGELGYIEAFNAIENYCKEKKSKRK